MPKITRKRCGELVRGVFQILLGKPEGLPSRQIFVHLAEIVAPTPFEESSYPSNPNIRRYENMVRFSTIAPVKAGWLLKDHGLWSLTEAGENAYKSFTDPEQFFRESIKKYHQWKDNQPLQENAVDGEQDNTGTPFATLLEESEENAWAAVMVYLAEMPPYDFQEVVAGLIEGMGHHIEWVAPPGRDGGVDIYATTDPLGISGKHIKVQVKRQQDTLAVDAIRSFRDTLKEGDTGLYISTGGFTKESSKEARHGQRHLVLIDAKRFFELWISHYEKIPEKRRRLLPIKLVAFLDPQ